MTKPRSVLDDPNVYRQWDPAGMRRLIGDLHLQSQDAWEKAKKLSLPSTYRNINNIIIVGMGGSAIGGGLLQTYALDICPLPIAVLRDYALPQYADERSLVIASSYSGNTEEVISAFAEALRRECRTVSVTSGGLLAREAAANGIPTFLIDHKGPPRTAVAYGLFPILAVLQDLNLIPNHESDVEETVKALEALSSELCEDVPESANQAKQIARDLEGRMPVIYGAGLLSEVARRWKTQINENSKSWAFYELLPELHHNTAAGYAFPSWLRDQAFVLLLHCASLHPRTSLRYQITKDILKENGIPYRHVEAWGSSRLSQMLNAVMLGDYVSLYLAMLNRVDPTPTPVLDYIKNRLEQSSLS